MFDDHTLKWALTLDVVLGFTTPHGLRNEIYPYNKWGKKKKIPSNPITKQVQTDK
jgi:hypothetical protein